MTKTTRNETFADYLRRWGREALPHLDVSTRVGALAYFLGTSPKTVSAWLRGAGPRPNMGRLMLMDLERLRAVVARVERELGRGTARALTPPPGRTR